MSEQLEKPITAIELEKILGKMLSNNAQHKVEHEFIKEMIVRRKINEQRIEKFKKSVIGAITVAVVGWGLAGLTMVGSYVMEQWK